jgi:tartrate-resistant acid phosphatase type 5
MQATLSAILPLIFGALASAQPATQSAQQVNLLTTGDFGHYETQKSVADAMAGYVVKNRVPLDAVLFTGDNFSVALSGPADPAFKRLFEEMYDARRLNVPFYVIAGNWDYWNVGDVDAELAYARLNPKSRWKYPAKWYRVEIPESRPLVTVFMLDNDREELLKSGEWKTQNDWLQQELAKPHATWTVFLAHYPLFSNGMHGDEEDVQKEWGPLLKQHKIDFYIAGHDHDLQHIEIPGYTTSFIVSGAGGKAARQPARVDRPAFAKGVNGFVHLRIGPEKADVRYIDVEGQTIHEFNRKKE